MGASGLGSLLVKEGFLTEQDRLTITKTCGQGSWAFAKSILAIGLLDEDELAAFFAERTRYQIVPKDFLKHLDPSAVQALDKRLVSKLEVIPLKKDSGKITVGVVDPLDRSTLKQLEFFTGLEVTPVVVPLSQLYEGLLRIDPDFKLSSTALTHFLQNHAQSAWVRQKLDSGDDPMASQPRSRAVGSGSDDIYDDLPEVEEVEDDEFGLDGEVVEEDADVEVEEEEEVEAESEDEPEISDGTESNSEEDDPFSESFETAQESDPFAGSSDSSAELADFDIGSLSDTSNIDHDLEDATDEVSESKDTETDDLLELVGADHDEDDGIFPSKIQNPKASSSFDFEASLESLDGLESDDSSPKAEADSARNALEESFDLDLSELESEENSSIDEIEDKDEIEKGHEIEEENGATSAPLSSFGFEETKPRAMPARKKEDDILDTLTDNGPSFEHEMGGNQPLDKDLLADLHTEADEHEIPISQYGQPVTLPPVTHEVKKVKAQTRPSFADDEDTNIDLSASPRGHDDDDDDDIRLHPKAETESSNAGLNPTSALNETMVKLSLCFGTESVFHVLKTYLFNIGSAGCLINTETHRQILWRAGELIEEELGPAALHPMLKGLENLRWKNMDLKASESWTQKSLKLRVYRQGNWLWAHALKASDDTLIFRETVESVVSQVANKVV